MSFAFASFFFTIEFKRDRMLRLELTLSDFSHSTLRTLIKSSLLSLLSSSSPWSLSSTPPVPVPPRFPPSPRAGLEEAGDPLIPFAPPAGEEEEPLEDLERRPPAAARAERGDEAEEEEERRGRARPSWVVVGGERESVEVDEEVEERREEVECG